MAAGRNRRPRLIQEVLDRNEMNIREYAETLGVNYTTVYETITGKRNNRKTLRGLLALDADPAILDLPKDLQHTSGVM